MYGFSRALLFVIPVGTGVLAILNAADASRLVAFAVLTVVVVLPAVLLAAILEERHGTFLDPR